MPKTVLITGCSAGGIGSALAVTFQKRGFRVFATARNVAKMGHLASLANVTLLPLDVASRASIDAAVAAVKKDTGGTLDILVNNAGTACVMPGIDVDMRRVRDVFEVNFFGVVETTQAFAPLVTAAQGTIVNICSANSLLTMPWMSEYSLALLQSPLFFFSSSVSLQKANVNGGTDCCGTGIYSASKAAIEQYSEGLRLELQHYNVKVLSVIGGGVTTNMTAASGVAPEPLPEGSFFKYSQAEIEREKAGISKVNGIPAEKFAEKVVADALSGTTGRVYRGFGASIVRVLTGLGPRFLQVSTQCLST